MLQLRHLILRTCLFCLGWLCCINTETVPVRIRERHSGRTTRSISETPALTVNVDLPGERTQLNLDRNTDQDANLAVYVMRTSLSGLPHVTRTNIGEQNMTLYQDADKGALFAIANLRNHNDTISVTMEGVLHKGDKIYDLTAQLPPDDITKGLPQSAERKRRKRSEDLLVHFDLRVIQDQPVHGAIDEVLLPPERKIDNPYKSSNERRKRAITQDVNIDVVAHVDYALYRLWFGRSNQTTDAGKSQDALNKIYLYYSLIFNGVNMMYKSIQTLPYNIHVRLSAILVALDAGSSSWTENNKGPPVANSTTPTLNTKVALDDLTSWASSKYNSASLPAYDHLMSFSGYDLVNEQGSNSQAGLAWTGTVCRTDGLAASIIEDEEGAFQSVGTAAHELGHGLSAQHDGTSNACDPNANYIMAAAQSRPDREANKLHPWRFSSCSIQNFSTYLDSISSTKQQCVYNIATVRSEVQNVTSAMPGQLYKVDDQCRQMFGSSSFACRQYNTMSSNNESNICDFQNLWCYIYSTPNTSTCRTAISFEGTTCGNKRWCLEGQCVYDTSAPTVSDNCPLGDSTGLVKDNLTCAQFVDTYKSACYSQDFQKICCSSCAKLYQPVQGCEYGDTGTGCSPSSCSISSNLPLCCRTCNYRLPTTTTPTPTITTTTPTTTTTPSTTATRTTTTVTTTTAPSTTAATPSTTRTSSTVSSSTTTTPTTTPPTTTTTPSTTPPTTTTPSITTTLSTTATSSLTTTKTTTPATTTTPSTTPATTTTPSTTTTSSPTTTTATPATSTPAAPTTTAVVTTTVPCAAFYYGTNCSRPCSCSTANSVSCSSTGTCKCKTGWQGVSCTDDVDECLLAGSQCSGASEKCQNTAGSFECVCASGTARNPSGVCTETKKIPFDLTINANVSFNDTDKNSTPYKLVEEDVKKQLNTSLVNQSSGVVDVNILSLKQGSVIVQAEAVIADNALGQAASSLVTSLIKISQSNFTVASVSGSNDVKVAGTKLSNASSPCSVLRTLGSCVGPTLICDDSSGQAVCRNPGESDSETWKGIVAPAVIGGFFVLVVIVAAVFLFVKSRQSNKRKQRSPEEDTTYHSTQSLYPPETNRNAMGPTSHAYANNAYTGIDHGHARGGFGNGRLSGGRPGDPWTRGQSSGVYDLPGGHSRLPSRKQLQSGKSKRSQT